MECIHGVDLRAYCVECYYSEIERKQMTREDAEYKLASMSINSTFLDRLEVLGLLKFDEPRSKHKTLSDQKVIPLVDGRVTDVGEYRLELWPEGLVLWVGGQIVYKSWERVYKKGDIVRIEGAASGNNSRGYLKGEG